MDDLGQDALVAIRNTAVRNIDVGKNGGTVTKHSGGLELTWTDKDKAILSIGDGEYDYTFVDPTDYRVSEVRLLHFIDRVDGPVPADRPSGLPTPTSDNLLVTGDAMHVLDALNNIPEYASKYVGKVKLVYIDPPFNTGKVFNKYEDNITHSIWLTLLRDRLRQIVPLLSDEGSIWIHLDDAEVHRCRMVLDEELGAKKFVGTVIWGKADTSRNDAKQFSTDQDYLLVYSKAENWRPNRLPRRQSQDAIYSSPDGDEHPWLAKPGHAPGAKTHQGMVYGIQSPFTGEVLYPPASGCWRLGEERMWAALNQWAPYKRVVLDDVTRRAAICDLDVEEMREVEAMMLDIELADAQARAGAVQDGVLPEVFFINDGSLIQVKGYKPEGLVPRTLWPFTAVGSNRNSKAETKKIFPGVPPFDTPKPERLIQRVIHLATDPGDIVLDCFAGSGTTAAVAHKMGRRWVTSELQPSNVATYVKPRLAKIVNGEDAVGVTSIKERVAADGVVLPRKVDPEDAQKFQTVLKKVLIAEDEPELDAEGDELVDEGDVTDTDDELDAGPVASPLTVNLDKELLKVLRAARKSGQSPLDDAEFKDLGVLLKKVAEADLATLDVTKPVRSEILKRTKTADRTTTMWHGGGGFAHVAVGPSMFEAIDGIIVLADWATHGELARAMCAQLSVSYRPDGIFAARSGTVRYVIVDGLVGAGAIGAILDQLPIGDIVQVWATQYDDDAATLLRKERPGSRLEAIPDSVLDSYKRKPRRGSPFKRPATDESSRSDETMSEA